MSTIARNQGPPAPPHGPEQSRGRRSRWTIAGLTVIFITVAFVLIRPLVRPGPSGVSAATPVSSSTPYVPVTRGPLLRTIRVGGTLAAVRFGGVSAPALRGQRFQMTLVRIVEAGSHVKEGDVVAEFDRQQQRLNFETSEAEFNSQADSILKRKAELKIEKEKQLSDLQKAKADLESAKLENRRNEVVSKIDAEKNRQTLEEAEANLTMLEQTLALRQVSAEAEIRLIEIKRDREKLTMEQARMNYDRLVVKAPVSGMVVYMPMWKGNRMGMPQEGDQVQSGMIFMQIVDTSAMAMRGRVNQLDAKYIRVGAPAEIHLDAYPSIKLSGRVETISPLAQNSGFGDKTRLFIMRLSIQGTDPRLIPDISASANVEIDRVENVLLIPRAAARRLGSGDYVWVQNGVNLEKRQVTLGAHDDIHWAVDKGLRQGETIAAIAPEDGTEKQAKPEEKSKPQAPRPEAKTEPQAQRPEAKTEPQAPRPEAKTEPQAPRPEAKK